jgi:hypothetical protein
MPVVQDLASHRCRKRPAFRDPHCRRSLEPYHSHMRDVFIWLLFVLLGAVVLDLSRAGLQARIEPEANRVHLLS